MIPTPASTTVDRFLAAIESATALTDLYAVDAELDAVVPGWRFARHGAGAIAAEYSGWFAHPGHLEDVSRSPVEGGEVIQYTLKWEEDGVAHTGRHVHVLQLDEDGRIASDHVWCGGRWPAPLLAEMEAAQRSSEEEKSPAD